MLQHCIVARGGSLCKLAGLASVLVHTTARADSAAILLSLKLACFRYGPSLALCFKQQLAKWWCSKARKLCHPHGAPRVSEGFCSAL